MKLKYSFEVVDMGDEYIAVPVGQGSESLHGILKLNKEGQMIFNLLQEETTVPLIVDTLLHTYKNDAKTIEGYVKAFVENLKSFDLIAE